MRIVLSLLLALALTGTAEAKSLKGALNSSGVKVKKAGVKVKTGGAKVKVKVKKL